MKTITCFRNDFQKGQSIDNQLTNILDTPGPGTFNKDQRQTRKELTERSIRK
jgi:hypothetical protein